MLGRLFPLLVLGGQVALPFAFSAHAAGPSPGRKLVDGTLQDLRTDRHDPGLHQYIRTAVGRRKTPAYVFDHHNFAFFGWWEAMTKGFIDKGALLLHIDTHADQAWPQCAPKSPIFRPQDAYRVASELEIYDFIGAGIHEGIIGEVLWSWPFDARRERFGEAKRNRWPRTERRSHPSDIPHVRMGLHDRRLAEKLAKRDRKQIIVDFDVDYFHDLLSGHRGVFNERLKKKMRLESLVEQDVAKIQALVDMAGLVTIATSPGFIQQEVAVALLQAIFPEPP